MIKERGHNKAKPAACSTISTSLHGFLWTSFSHCLVFHLWTHDLFQPTVDFVERWQSLLLRWGPVQEITFHQNLKCCNGDWGQTGQIVLAWWLRANWTNCACMVIEGILDKLCLQAIVDSLQIHWCIQQAVYEGSRRRNKTPPAPPPMRIYSVKGLPLVPDLLYIYIIFKKTPQQLISYLFFSTLQTKLKNLCYALIPQHLHNTEHTPIIININPPSFSFTD